MITDIWIVIIEITGIVGKTILEAKRELRINPNNEFAKGQLDIAEKVLEKLPSKNT